MVDDKIMEMALEMLDNSQVVTEAGMDAMKLWYTNERKEAYKAWMSARWCRLREIRMELGRIIRKQSLDIQN